MRLRPMQVGFEGSIGGESAEGGSAVASRLACAFDPLFVVACSPEEILETDQPVVRAGPPVEGLLGADGSQSVGAKFRS